MNDMGTHPDNDKTERTIILSRLEQERDELRMMVERLVTVAEDAQPIVCSMLCISVRKVGHEWDHSALCTRIQATIQKATKGRMS